MNLILRYLEGRRSAPVSADPKLTQELKEVREQLKSILTKWKFGDTPLTSAEEFLNNFEPWINRQLEQQREWKVFLAKHGLHNLAEIKNVNTPESESEQLKFFKENIKIKEQIIDEYKKDEEIWKNTEADYLKKIDELQKSRETSEEAETIKQELTRKTEEWNLTEQDYLQQIADQDQELKAKIQEFQASNGELLKKIEELENQATPELSPEVEQLETEIQDLKSQLETYQKGEDWESKTGEIITSLEQEIKDFETEKDELTRDKKTLEQENLALHNRLNLKNEEVNKKSAQIELLKKEKSQTEITLNKTITELRAEQKKLQVKYSKQGRLLDEEQTDNNKLTEKIEALETEIQQLKGAK